MYTGYTLIWQAGIVDSQICACYNWQHNSKLADVMGDYSVVC
jgi:hypothetical protein